MDRTVPVGLILLVGPPAAGKSSFARAWLELGRIDAGGVVSCDAIRAEMFGARVRVADDPAVFDEMDARVSTRLAAGLSVVVDATHVTPHSRTRMLSWARQHGRPVTALCFHVADDTLLDRNSVRTGHARVPTEELLRYSAIASTDAHRGRLLGEGFDVVVDVPGEAEGASPTDAAKTIRLAG